MEAPLQVVSGFMCDYDNRLSCRDLLVVMILVSVDFCKYKLHIFLKAGTTQRSNTQGQH